MSLIGYFWPEDQCDEENMKLISIFLPLFYQLEWKSKTWEKVRQASYLVSKKWAICPSERRHCCCFTHQKIFQYIIIQTSAKRNLSINVRQLMVSWLILTSQKRQKFINIQAGCITLDGVLINVHQLPSEFFYFQRFPTRIFRIIGFQETFFCEFFNRPWQICSQNSTKLLGFLPPFS